MVFVYLLENNPESAGLVQKIYARMRARRDRLMTSTFTLGELLVAPFRTGDIPLSDAIRDFLAGPDVDLLLFDEKAAEAYAEIRATTGARPADSVHLACAARANVDLFITNDKKLLRLTVPGIRFFASLDVALKLFGR
jgi:predicted nucleic acid-binding protein